MAVNPLQIGKKEAVQKQRSEYRRRISLQPKNFHSFYWCVNISLVSYFSLLSSWETGTDRKRWRYLESRNNAIHNWAVLRSTQNSEGLCKIIIFTWLKFFKLSFLRPFPVEMKNKYENHIHRGAQWYTLMLTCTFGSETCTFNSPTCWFSFTIRT